MAGFGRDVEQVRAHDYRLQFKVPTEEERKRMRRIHRDKTAAEVAKQENAISNVETLLSMIESGELDPEEIPDGLKKRLSNLWSNR